MISRKYTFTLAMMGLALAIPPQLGIGAILLASLVWLISGTKFMLIFHLILLRYIDTLWISIIRITDVNKLMLESMTKFAVGQCVRLNIIPDCTGKLQELVSNDIILRASLSGSVTLTLLFIVSSMPVYLGCIYLVRKIYTNKLRRWHVLGYVKNWKE